MADYQELVQFLGSGDIMKIQAATMILIALQEEAINPLGDQLYAGVTDEQGVGILRVVSEIGGPDALAMLRNIFEFESSRPLLQLAAAEGLFRNKDSLSDDEMTRVTVFLANNAKNSGSVF